MSKLADYKVRFSDLKDHYSYSCSRIQFEGVSGIPNKSFINAKNFKFTTQGILDIRKNDDDQIGSFIEMSISRDVGSIIYNALYDINDGEIYLFDFINLFPSGKIVNLRKGFNDLLSLSGNDAKQEAIVNEAEELKELVLTHGSVIRVRSKMREQLYLTEYLKGQSEWIGLIPISKLSSKDKPESISEAARNAEFNRLNEWLVRYFNGEELSGRISNRTDNGGNTIIQNELTPSNEIIIH